MKLLFLITRYINYLIRAKSRYNIHSKFVYDFIENVVRDKTQYPDYEKLNRVKTELLSNHNPIETVDFGSGAGEKQYDTNVIAISKIVKRRTHSRKQLELLFRLSKYFKPKNVLEFGTALGISTSYIYAGNPEAKLITMEGCANLAAKATEVFDGLNYNSIEIAIGNFDTNLDRVLSDIDTLDFVFFDGNHKKEPTIKYYESCVKLSNENSIFVFDDIHWSAGMEEAWDIIKSDKRVSLTIDLFWFGIVFFRKGIEKQNFIIRC